MDNNMPKIIKSTNRLKTVEEFKIIIIFPLMGKKHYHIMTSSLFIYEKLIPKAENILNNIDYN